MAASTAAEPVIYYGAGSGLFTATVHASTPLAGLAAITFGDATSAGRDYPQSGPLTTTVTHAYQFAADSTFDSATGQAITVTAIDRAGNQATRAFSILRDVAVPQVSYFAQQQGLTMALSWQITDPLAGIRSCTVTIAQDDQILATFEECSSTWQYQGANDTPYQVTFVAVDNVGNRTERTATVTLTGITTYYPADSSRAAMRQDDTVLYLQGDHLGSTSLVTDSAGRIVHTQRYRPYGEERWAVQ